MDLLLRLARHLDYSAARYRELERAYSGDRGLNFLPDHIRDEVGDRLKPVSPNFCRLVVDAVAERLSVEGFRLGEDEAGSDDLWSIWQRNGLDELSALVHLEALVSGRAYVSVWPGPNGPVIAPESPRQTTVLTQPHNRRRIAAMKRYLDLETRRAVAILFTPETVTRYESPSEVAVDTYLTAESGLHLHEVHVDFAYVPPTTWDKVDEQPNPLGTVPIVPLENRPRLLSFGESELKDVLQLQDGISKLWADVMVASEFGAMPRRYVTGLAIQEDEDGNPVPPFDERSGRLWQAEDEAVEFGQFDAADLSVYSSVITQLVSQLAATASLPPHYVHMSQEPSSADAIRSSEASLVAKCRARQRTFGGAWEDVMRLAVMARDGYLPDGYDALEAMWADPETRTVAQATDAAHKRFAMGWPLEVLAEDLGYSPQAVERIVAGQERERRLAEPTSPTPLESQREIRRDEETAA